MLADPVRRRELEEQAHGTQGLIRAIAHWQRLIFLETFAPENAGYAGRTVGEVAAERGQSPFDALCDIAIADDLRTVFSTPEFGNDRADWEARVAVWRDGRAVIGASDAGAHLDLLATFNYTTTTLAERCASTRCFRSRRPCSCSPTCPPASTACAIGAASPRVRTPTSSSSTPRRSARPGRHAAPTCRPGAARVYGEAEGIDEVIVNGTVIVEHGAFTDARPGTLLRSGRDTETPVLS